MTYSKPEVTLLDAAVEVIQAMGKSPVQSETPFSGAPTSYESDE
jgi:hypothetical protein